MAIPEQGTFEYEANFTAEGIKPSEIDLQGRDRGLGGRQRLVGLHPAIRFWSERLIVASRESSIRVRHVTYPIGDTVHIVARPDDSLYVTRADTGDLGLSIIRGNRLVFGLGAVTTVPLGEGMDIEVGGLDGLAKQPTWLDLAICGESVQLRDRDRVQFRGYDVYVERCFQVDEPGIHECVSISRAKDQASTAAMRSAVLLAHEGCTLKDWDFKKL